MDSDCTKTVYTMIKDQRYDDVIPLLRNELNRNQSSRMCLSLLAYCYFEAQDFLNAAEHYHRLSKLVPNEIDYMLYYAQSLYQACMYDKAMKVLASISDRSYHGKIAKLQAAIKYGEEDFVSARYLLENIPGEDPDTKVNQACILYKEGSYQEALSEFSSALMVQGYNPHLSYSMALCNYKLKDFTQAAQHICEILNRGIEEHPEMGMGVGVATEGIQFGTVGNTMALHDTALIETFNLKAAIEYKLGNVDAAREALTDMPPRSEEELDAVTLHNQALMNMEKRPAEGFEKLEFLLQQNPFPPETLGNLLLLYCKYGYYNLAADVIAENQHLTHKYLSDYLYGFIDALITQQTSPVDAYKKFEEIAVRHTESMRKSCKSVQDARLSGDDLAAKKAISDYDDSLDRYIPVIMAQAKIYWDLEQYDRVEGILRKSVEFCNENDTWRLQVANALFIQDKYTEAIKFYEPIVKKSFTNLLVVNPVVLANLCVSYVMSSMNQEAESIISAIDSGKTVNHFSIVNRIIGMLYCSKDRFTFGIPRLIQSFKPCYKNLSADSWYYAKSCILYFVQNLAKKTVFPSDELFQSCLDFLTNCETFGKYIKTTVKQEEDINYYDEGKNSIAYEARILKELLIRVQIPNSLL